MTRTDATDRGLRPHSGRGDHRVEDWAEVTSTPGATTSVTQLTPATGPANTTLPAAGARTSSPTGAAMSIPRCPGPNGAARASNLRTSGPVTGIHNAGTRGDRGSTGAHEE